MGKLFLILLLTAGLFPALFAREKTQEEEKDPYKNISVFMHSIQILREKYVDKEKTSYENLLRAACAECFRNSIPSALMKPRRNSKAQSTTPAGNSRESA